jgi:hypothetical protein
LLLRQLHDLERFPVGALADLVRGRLGRLEDRADLAADLRMALRAVRLLGPPLSSSGRPSIDQRPYASDELVVALAEPKTR